MIIAYFCFHIGRNFRTGAWPSLLRVLRTHRGRIIYLGTLLKQPHPYTHIVDKNNILRLRAIQYLRLINTTNTFTFIFGTHLMILDIGGRHVSVTVDPLTHTTNSSRCRHTKLHLYLYPFIL